MSDLIWLIAGTFLIVLPYAALSFVPAWMRLRVSKKSFCVLAACGFIAYVGFVIITQLFFVDSTRIFVFLCLVGAFLVYYISINMVVQTEKSLRAEANFRRIEEEKESLDRLSRMEREMVAAISHETRTPLAVLSVYAKLASMELKSQGVNEQTARDLDTIFIESRRVANMMERMQTLYLCKDTEIKKTSVDMGELALSIGRLYEPILERRKTYLETEITGGLPTVLGSTDELTQVVFNLLQNAKNHTEDGKITVTVKMEGREWVAEGENDDKNNAGRVKVAVSDTGKGVAPELLTRIFERGTCGGGGNGLGLALCKDIIEAHGGEINIKSEIGKGTVASFTLPAYSEVKVDGK